MAGNVKAKVYTGATAALSVLDENGVSKRVAYVSDFTIDLSSNSEDFNILGQLYQESIPTYNSWSASSSAKASFENDGQRLLMRAYNNLDQIKCEFIVNNSTNANEIIKFTGWAIIESLSIGVGDSVSTFDISVKGSGDLDVDLPSITYVTGLTLNPTEVTLNVGDAKTIDFVLTPKNASNPDIKWTLSEGGEEFVTLNQRGQIVANKATGVTEVTVTATANGASPSAEPITATCKVTVA